MLIAKTDIAGPGFINFTLDQGQLIAQLNQAWADERCGVQSC